MLPLSTYELRVLKAIDERPGGVTVPVIAQLTGFSDPDIGLSLSILEHDGLITRSTIQRSSATWWRITRTGVDRLIATPPPRLRRSRKKGAEQTSILDVPGVA